MSKGISKAHLNKIKAEKIIAMKADWMKMLSIAKSYMKEDNLGQTQLIHHEVSDIDKAASFCRHMLKSAEEFKGNERPQ